MSDENLNALNLTPFSKNTYRPKQKRHNCIPDFSSFFLTKRFIAEKLTDNYGYYFL